MVLNIFQERSTCMHFNQWFLIQLNLINWACVTFFEISVFETWGKKIILPHTFVLSANWLGMQLGLSLNQEIISIDFL